MLSDTTADYGKPALPETERLRDFPTLHRRGREATGLGTDCEFCSRGSTSTPFGVRLEISSGSRRRSLRICACISIGMFSLLWHRRFVAITPIRSAAKALTIVTIKGSAPSCKLPISLDSDAQLEIENYTGDISVRVAPASIEPVVGLQRGGTNGLARCDRSSLSVSADGGCLEITVPQRLGRVTLRALGVDVVGKLEVGGSSRIEAKRAHVETMRAHTNEMICETELTVTKLLEATEARVEAEGTVLAKLQAKRAAVCSSIKTQVETAYCSELVATGADLHIDTFHGHAHARLAGSLSIAHLSGSLDAIARDVDVCFDWTAATSRVVALADVRLLLCADDDLDLSLKAPTIDSQANALRIVEDVRAADGSRLLDGRLVSSSALRKYDRGGGKIDVAAANDQRWQSAVQFDRPANSRLEASAGRLLTLLKPSSWIDNVRAKCDPNFK